MKLKEEEEARLAAEADKRDNALRQQGTLLIFMYRDR